MRRLGLSNVELVLSRAEDYRPSETCECVCSSYLAKYADLPLLTRNTHQMLADGGLLLMHDFIYPPSRAVQLLWKVYFKSLQFTGTPLFPEWREIFYGLPELIRRTRWVEELGQALRANRFREIRTEALTLHGSAIVNARK